MKSSDIHILSRISDYTNEKKNKTKTSPTAQNTFPIDCHYKKDKHTTVDSTARTEYNVSNCSIFAKLSQSPEVILCACTVPRREILMHLQWDAQHESKGGEEIIFFCWASMLNSNEWGQSWSPSSCYNTFITQSPSVVYSCLFNFCCPLIHLFWRTLGPLGQKLYV